MFEFDLPTFPNWPCGMDADLMIGFFKKMRFNLSIPTLAYDQD